MGVLPHAQPGHGIPLPPPRPPTPAQQMFPLLPFSSPFFTFYLKQNPSRTPGRRPPVLAARPCPPFLHATACRFPPLLSVLALSFWLLDSRTGHMRVPAGTPCHPAHSTSFRARLRRHFFRETVLSQGEPTPATSPPAFPGGTTHIVLFLPAGLQSAHWTLSFQNVPAGRLTTESHLAAGPQRPVERPHLRPALPTLPFCFSVQGQQWLPFSLYGRLQGSPPA